MATVHHGSPTIYERGQAVFPLAKRLVLRVCMAGLVSRACPGGPHRRTGFNCVV